MRRLLVGTVAALGMVAAACGDSDDDSTTATTAPEAPASVVEYEFTGPAPVLAADGRGVFAASDQLLYLLGPAEMTGESLERVSVGFRDRWLVDVEFDEAGATAFDAMAERLFGSQVAIVLDGGVVSAPTINATEFGGVAVITGPFDEALVRDLSIALQQDGSILEFRPVIQIAEDTPEGRAELEALLDAG